MHEVKYIQKQKKRKLKLRGSLWLCLFNSVWDCDHTWKN